MTSSAPFSSAAFTTVLKSGSRRSSSAALNFVSSCHSAPGKGFGIFHSLMTYTTRSVRWPRDLHSTYRLSRAICTTFPLSAQARPGGGWPIRSEMAYSDKRHVARQRNHNRQPTAARNAAVFQASGSLSLPVTIATEITIAATPAHHGNHQTDEVNDDEYKANHYLCFGFGPISTGPVLDKGCIGSGTFIASSPNSVRRYA